jgi:hypothetical protein
VATEKNKLYYGDNYDVLKRYAMSEHQANHGIME